MQVVAEVFERGEQGGQFPLRPQLAQFFEAGPQEIGVD
jgi:hypothetical protein